MKLVQFVDTNKKEHWVNADRVCSVRDFANDITEIHFGTDDGKVLVREQIGLVVRKLAGAGMQ